MGAESTKLRRGDPGVTGGFTGGSGPRPAAPSFSAVLLLRSVPAKLRRLWAPRPLSRDHATHASGSRASARLTRRPAARTRCSRRSRRSSGARRQGRAAGRSRPGRTNVLALWGEPRVLFSTHLDTVPPFIPPRLEGDVALRPRHLRREGPDRRAAPAIAKLRAARRVAPRVARRRRRGGRQHRRARRARADAAACRRCASLDQRRADREPRRHRPARLAAPAAPLPRPRGPFGHARARTSRRPGR